MNKLVHAAWVAMALATALPVRAETQDSCPPASQAPTAEMIQAASRSARDHGFLWRMVKDGRTSYLYGTIHVGKLDWAVPGPTLVAALRETDTVALELDMLDPQVQQDMAGAMANMKTAELPADLVQRLRRASERECLAYDVIARLAPEFQIITLTLADARREGLDAGYATDIVLAGAGHGGNKKVVSLETVESQMRLLQSDSPREAAETVKDGLDQLEGGAMRTVLRRLARVWAESDYADMTRYDDWCRCRETESERAMMKRVLDDRNPKLAERIDELHRGGGRVFAAVGALHMFGANSLPSLLRARGYQVERVPFPGR